MLMLYPELQMTLMFIHSNRRKWEYEHLSDMHGTHKGFTTHKHTFTQTLHINVQLNKR